MKLHPFYEVVANAENYMSHGAVIYQQFNCAKCGTKQTMEDPNVFRKLGRCEECGFTTDIEKNGCNFMMTFGGPL
jgi:predicted RNA-binding Zn-ribbon protein involved in translation (DUF1610 family)